MELSQTCLQVLITKLRSANTVETRQYHKASKALLVLIPLLGITYLVFLIAPSEGFVRHVFAYCRATLISTQVGIGWMRQQWYLIDNFSNIVSGILCLSLLLLLKLRSPSHVEAPVSSLERGADHSEWAGSSESEVRLIAFCSVDNCEDLSTTMT